MTNEDKQQLYDYIKENPYDKPKEIQLFCGCSLATIRKYQKIIQKKIKETEQDQCHI